MRSDLAGRLLASVLVLASGGACAADAPIRASSRGSLLYSTECVSCHTAQVHWREKKLATDLGKLQEQVRRWQGVAGLAWSEGDIAEVTRYLNEVHYHYPPAR